MPDVSTHPPEVESSDTGEALSQPRPPVLTAGGPESLPQLVQQALSDNRALAAAAHAQIPPERRQEAGDLMVAILAAQAQEQGVKEETFDEDLNRAGERGAAPAIPPPRETTTQRVNKMSVSEKLRVALFGGREERFLLIKSVNRIIASAVLKSPKTTEAEVELISQMRNVHLDVLLTIANTPSWSRKRTIALNLIRNPRTPVAITLRLLHQLNVRDLQIVARDRGIPEAVRRTALRALAEANRKH